MESCPKELEPYDIAYNMKLIEQDRLQHMWWGNYGVSALIVAIDACFNKNSKAEFVKEPLLSKVSEMKTSYKESNEEIAVFEMKQRIKLLEKQGLPQSPI